MVNPVLGSGFSAGPRESLFTGWEGSDPAPEGLPRCRDAKPAAAFLSLGEKGAAERGSARGLGSGGPEIQ